jgi:hypothetical protein
MADRYDASQGPPVTRFIKVTVVLDIGYSCLLFGPLLVGLARGTLLFTSAILAVVGAIGVIAGVQLLQGNRWGIWLGWTRVYLSFTTASMAPFILFFATAICVGWTEPISASLFFMLAIPVWGPLLLGRVVVLFLYIGALTQAARRFPRYSKTYRSTHPTRTPSSPTRPRTGPFVASIAGLDIVLAILRLGGIWLQVLLIWNGDLTGPFRSTWVLELVILGIASALAVVADRLILERRMAGVHLGWIKMGLLALGTTITLLSSGGMLGGAPASRQLVYLSTHVGFPILYAIMLVRAGRLFDLSRHHRRRKR